MVYVKVCGIRTKEEINICISEGVNALGFICGVTHKAEDAIDIDTAQKLISLVPPFVSTVLVTHIKDPYNLSFLIKKIPAGIIQIQDYVHPTDILFLKDLYPERKFIKAIHINNGDAFHCAKYFENFVDALLFDTKTDDRIGGTGIPHDWSLSRKIRDSVKCPVILAGGLSPDNVTEAVKTVVPFGVDANSRLEDENGYKDRNKIREFVRKANTCL